MGIYFWFRMFSSHLAFVFAQSIEARYYVENEDVVEAAPTGDAPATSEWWSILLATRVRLILEVLLYGFVDVILSVISVK